MRRSIIPATTLPGWAKANGVYMDGITLATSPRGYGTGLMATVATSTPEALFLQVPSRLLLNRTLVWSLSETDSDLAAILAANGEYAKSSRGAILIFLLMQIAHSSPDILESKYEQKPIGEDNVFSEYIQYIQTESSLPSFWPEEDISNLWGTSLAKHHAAKMRFLREEFERFRTASESLPWKDIWLGEQGCLTFEDWLTVDAMWRSRAMDLSKDGDDLDACLVPVMDMANHTTEGLAAYRLATDTDGQRCAQLTLDSSAALIQEFDKSMRFTQNQQIEKGTEITISYGSIKGAAEMIFSYGFLDTNYPDARSLMLGWSLPEDDPLRFEKVAALNLEPGIQIYTPVVGCEHLRFVSTAVWAMSVNEEDGLKIEVEQDPNTGEPIYKMLFKDILITSKSHLINLLTHDRAALIFKARAYAYVYMRVEEELSRIAELVTAHEEEKQSSPPALVSNIPNPREKMCANLRLQETALLEKALRFFGTEVNQLMQHPDVTSYPTLLEQGLTLPELSETELWHRFEDEHDEKNRREYVQSLERELAALIAQAPRITSGSSEWTGFQSEDIEAWNDKTDEDQNRQERQRVIEQIARDVVHCQKVNSGASKLVQLQEEHTVL